MNNAHWSKRISGLAHQGGEPHLVLEAARTHQVLANAFSRLVGEPMSRLNLLRAVAVGPEGGSGVLAIAKRLEINAAAVTRLLKDLEREQLVTRRKDRRDGRRCYFTLTEKGLHRLVEIHERYHNFERKLLASADRADVAAAVRVLNLVRNAAADLE